MAEHRARHRAHHAPRASNPTSRRGTDLVVGAATALVVFAAVPAVLVAFVGWPLPHPWRASTVLSARGLLDGLAVIAWFAWAACCAPVAAKVVGRVRRRETASVPGASWADRLAGRIATGILVLAPLTGLATAAGAASPPRPVPVAAAVVTPSSLQPTAPTSAVPPSPPGAPTQLPTRYTVQVGDSLWSIADALYGDGGDWEVLAKANLGQTMDDGTQFSDPSLIMAGWVLNVPPLTNGPGPTDTSPPPSTTAAPAPTEAMTAAVAPANPPASPTTSRSSNGVAHATGSHRSSVAPRRRATRARHSALPELAALGLGAVVAAALARRARRSRLARALERHEGESVIRHSDLAEETASLLIPFDGVPALDWLERANRHLGLVLEGSEEAAPGMVCLRIGPDGLTAVLDRPVEWAPPGWRRRGGQRWHLSAPFEATLGRPGVERARPWVPALVPLGENAEGSWFACLEAGACLPVVGAGAEDAVAAMEAALESWSWSGELVVTRNPETADDAALRSTGGDPGSRNRRRQIVFLGDPDDLTPSARRACVAITTQPRRATRLLVAVDGGLASLHPLGITVRPDRLEPARRRAVAELVDQFAPPDDLDRDPPPGQPDVALTASQPALPLLPPAERALRRVPTPPPEAAEPEPVGSTSAAIEVHLLTAEPRLEGLAGPLPPKRARRATELVAYLALHQPEPVTSDRLRTRVLGSPDADAASKTLFNTVGAARRAMGSDHDGLPHLPTATKAGHYRLGPHVTTDVARALELVARAEASEDPEQVMAYLRAALELVESEPLARIYSGYSWWRAEGHERRIAGCLVDAACRLSRLASPAGHPGLARWAIDQARLVEPYSEALSRAAMEVAAESGDIDGLRQEWFDCKRRVDELDPGSAPSESTHELYDRLRKGLPTEVGAKPNTS